MQPRTGSAPASSVPRISCKENLITTTTYKASKDSVVSHTKQLCKNNLHGKDPHFQSPGCALLIRNGLSTLPRHSHVCILPRILWLLVHSLVRNGCLGSKLMINSSGFRNDMHLPYINIYKKWLLVWQDVTCFVYGFLGCLGYVIGARQLPLTITDSQTNRQFHSIDFLFETQYLIGHCMQPRCIQIPKVALKQITHTVLQFNNL